MSSERLGDIRSLLHNPPDAPLFLELTELLEDGVLTDPERDYLLEQLQRWPETVKRTAPPAWIARAAQDQRCEALILCNRIQAWDEPTWQQFLQLPRWWLRDHLHELSLSFRGLLGRERLEALARLQLEHLECFEIRGVMFDEDSARALAEALESLPRLGDLGLVHTGLDLAELELLLESGRLEGLHTLDLSRSYGLDLVGAFALARAECLRTLRNLYLDDVFVDLEGIRALEQSEFLANCYVSQSVAP